MEEEEEKVRRQRQARLLKQKGTQRVSQNKGQGTCLLSFSFRQLHSKVLTVKTNTALQCRGRKNQIPITQRQRRKKINQVMPNLIIT